MRATDAAAMFSSRCSTEDVPGIGSMIGERASSQASANCDGLAWCAAAIFRNGPSLASQRAGS